MHFRLFFLLFFLFFQCTTPPKSQKENEGIVFQIYNIQNNSSPLKKVKEIIPGFSKEDSIYEIAHRTFAITLQVVDTESAFSNQFQSSFMVDTGSDSTLHKKNNYFSKGKIFSSPIHTANEQQEEKLEVFVRSLYHPAGKFLKKEKLFVTKSIDPLPVDGILGNSFFSDFVLYVEYPKFLVLYPPTNWEISRFQDYEEISAISEIQTHWVFPVSIKGKNYLFLFDTGADYTVFEPDLAKTFFYLKNKTIQYMEFSGKLYESRVYLAPEICISKTSCVYDVVGLSSSALSSFLKNDKYKIHGILGMNWIKDYNFALDYTRRKLYLIKRK